MRLEQAKVGNHDSWFIYAWTDVIAVFEECDLCVTQSGAL